MSKTRVYELAKELDIEAKDLIPYLEKIGIAVKSHASTLEDHEVERIKEEYKLGERNKVIEKRVKATVIRRRSVREQPQNVESVSASMPASEETTGQGEEEPSVEPIKVVSEDHVEETIEKVSGEKRKEIKRKEESKIQVTIIGKKDIGLKTQEKSQKTVQDTEAAVPLATKGESAAVGVKSVKTIIETETVEAKEEKAVIPESEKRKEPQPSKKQPETVEREKRISEPKEEPKADQERETVKKKKKTVKVVVDEAVPRKKAIARQRVEKKAKRVKEDLSEETLKSWKQEKKEVVVQMKETEITTPKAIKRRIKIDEAIRVVDLAKKMGVKSNELITKLISLGLMVSINQAIDADTATLIAGEFGYQVESSHMEPEEIFHKEEISPEKLKPRAPVVTVMGHVDHGKTSLLDAIRKTNVIDGESGGITQAIGAYHVQIEDKDIIFLDTPGHEAFTAMRARGAQVTDIVILVVAADDGVMDQTAEAINHAKAAGVPIIVAVNKIDKPGADPERIKQQLTEYGLVPEAWGGDAIFVEVSAKQKIGIEELLELILLQADIMELKADPDRHAQGVVIESKLDKGRGPVATVLIQQGTLHEGESFVCKPDSGKVRAMVNDKGQRVEKAGPSMPIEVIGFSSVPQVGVDFVCVEDEKKARNFADYWQRKEREKELTKTSKLTLEQLYEKIKEGAKEFNVILKADVQGSIGALSDALLKLSTDDVKLKIIHSSTGSITETDIMLASASDAIIIGFKVRPDIKVMEAAEQEGVDIKLYDIIYNLIADVKAAMEGLLEPVYEEVVEGHAEIREVFKISKIGTIAGAYVTDGKISRSSGIRLVRDGIVIFNGKIKSLKRFKDDVREVTSGFECGLGIEGYDDLKAGDVIEAYTKKELERKL